MYCLHALQRILFFTASVFFSAFIVFLCFSAFIVLRLRNKKTDIHTYIIKTWQLQPSVNLIEPGALKK